MTPEESSRGRASRIGTLARRSVYWLIPLLLAVVTFTVFLPALRNEFVDWDDRSNLIDNPHYRGLGWRQIGWMFTSLHMGHWVPLTWMTFGADYLVWGMNPFGYHLTNLLLHSAAACVFYFVALRLLRLTIPDLGESTLRVGAGVSALFFAIHPLRVESVAWATERRDVLSGLFFLLTILGYLRALAANKTRRWFAASVGCYALALMSKATVMSLPVTLLLLDWYPLGRLGRRWQWLITPEARKVWVEKSPYLLLGLAGASMALYAQAANRVPTPFEDLPLPGRVSIMLWSLWFYVWKTLIPLGLSPLYEAPLQVNPLDPRFLGSGIAVGVITAGLLMLHRRWPAGLAVWIYYGVTLAPVSGLAHGGPQLTADRYSYLSCLGWALLVGAGVVWVAVGASKGSLLSPSWGYGMGAASAAWLIALGVLTWQQVHVWRDTKTLWTYTLSLYPNSSFAHNNLGALLARQGKLDEALPHYRKVLEVNPNLEKAAVYLGAILYAKGNVPEAIEHYQRVLEMNPEFAEVHNNLGALLDRQGKADEAIAHYRQALRLRPTIAEAHFNLGRALLKRGKLDKAIKQIQRAVQINPDYIEARKLLDAVRTGKATRSVTTVEGPQASRREIEKISKGVPELVDRQPAVTNQGLQ